MSASSDSAAEALAQALADAQAEEYRYFDDGWTCSEVPPESVPEWISVAVSVFSVSVVLMGVAAVAWVAWAAWQGTDPSFRMRRGD